MTKKPNVPTPPKPIHNDRTGIITHQANPPKEKKSN